MTWQGLLALGLGVLPIQAVAQEINPCDGRTVATNLVEPWQQNTHVFADGTVRVALIDTVEPAAAAFYVMVISAPLDVLDNPQCRLLGATGGLGFAALDFAAMTLADGTARRLSFDIPAQIIRDTVFVPVVMRFTLDRVSGDIDYQLGPARK
jgi:hypothetical protein